VGQRGMGCAPFDETGEGRRSRKLWQASERREARAFPDPDNAKARRERSRGGWAWDFDDGGQESLLGGQEVWTVACWAMGIVRGTSGAVGAFGRG